MTKYQISVTKTDIKKGCRWTADNCPIARAMQRVFKRAVSVYQGGWCFLRKGTKRQCKERALPPEASNFVTAFDCGHTVQPFKFTVTA